jgi:methanethiol S-methyltransferase
LPIQIIFVGLFALNLYPLWKTGRYRLPGNFFFLCLPLVTPFLDQPRFALDYFWWRAAGLIAVMLGAALLVWTQRSLGKVFANIGEPPAALATSGPYELFRHPFYLGLIFIFVGWWWLWAAVYAFYFGMFILALIWVQGYLEEKLVLEKKFGDRYREYKKDTGMFWVK